VLKILASLKVPEDVPMIEVWNKIDLLDADAHDAHLAEAERRDAVVPTSAVTGEGVETLLNLITSHLADPSHEETLQLTWAQGRLLAWLHTEEVIQEQSEHADGWQVNVRWTQDQARRYNLEASKP